MVTTLEPLRNDLAVTFGPEARPRLFVPVAVSIMRQLAKGEPVSALALANSTNTPIEEVAQALDGIEEEGVLERNSDGCITGMLLTLTKTRHQFEVAGRILYTWCALDALLLPKILNVAASVTSTCPETGVEIRVAVSPDGIRAVHPDGVFVSVVVPETAQSSCCERLAGVNGSLCSNIHFFASETAANAWLTQHPGAHVVPLAEAFELGTMWSDAWLTATG